MCATKVHQAQRYRRRTTAGRHAIVGWRKAVARHSGLADNARVACGTDVPCDCDRVSASIGALQLRPPTSHAICSCIDAPHSKKPCGFRHMSLLQGESGLKYRIRPVGHLRCALQPLTRQSNFSEGLGSCKAFRREFARSQPDRGPRLPIDARRDVVARRRRRCPRSCISCRLMHRRQCLEGSTKRS